MSGDEEFGQAVQRALAQRYRAEAGVDPTQLPRLRQVRPLPVSDDELLDLMRTALPPASARTQAIKWTPTSWIGCPPHFDEAWTTRIRTLAEATGWTESDGGTVSISRAQVFAHSDPADLFLAALIWGFGQTGYGWSRTKRIIEASTSIPETVEAYVDASRMSPEAVWRSWSRSPHRIRGLGTAFASKVAYFAAYDRTPGLRPLISDRNTRWAVWILTGYWAVERSRWNSDDDGESYATYVRWAHDTAAREGIEPEDVELALFEIGRTAVRRNLAAKAAAGVGHTHL